MKTNITNEEMKEFIYENVHLLQINQTEKFLNLNLTQRYKMLKKLKENNENKIKDRPHCPTKYIMKLVKQFELRQNEVHRIIDCLISHCITIGLEEDRHWKNIMYLRDKIEQEYFG